MLPVKLSKRCRIIHLSSLRPRRLAPHQMAFDGMPRNAVPHLQSRVFAEARDHRVWGLQGGALWHRGPAAQSGSPSGSRGCRAACARPWTPPPALTPATRRRARLRSMPACADCCARAASGRRRCARSSRRSKAPAGSSTYKPAHVPPGMPAPVCSTRWARIAALRTFGSWCSRPAIPPTRSLAGSRTSCSTHNEVVRAGQVLDTAGIVRLFKEIGSERLRSALGDHLRNRRSAGSRSAGQTRMAHPTSLRCRTWRRWNRPAGVPTGSRIAAPERHWRRAAAQRPPANASSPTRDGSVPPESRAQTDPARCASSHFQRWSCT